MLYVSCVHHQWKRSEISRNLFNQYDHIVTYHFDGSGCVTQKPCRPRPSIWKDSWRPPPHLLFLLFASWTDGQENQSVLSMSKSRDLRAQFTRSRPNTLDDKTVDSKMKVLLNELQFNPIDGRLHKIKRAGQHSYAFLIPQCNIRFGQPLTRTRLFIRARNSRPRTTLKLCPGKAR